MPHENGQADTARRGRAVRTAWIMAAVAFAVYVSFILSGVLGAASIS